MDKITQERDSTVVAKLDAALVEAINDGTANKIWLAVPEIVSWEEIDGFAYKLRTPGPKRPGPALYSDIDTEGWLVETKLAGGVTLDHLSRRKIYQCFKDERQPASWSVYRCLNVELDLDGSKYILNDGEWYNVDREYVSDIDKFYTGIPMSKLVLPAYGTKTEPKYLEGLKKTHPEFAVMDGKNVMIGGGRSRIEFCDLYSKNKDIVHAKQYGGSSLLSHLFSQAVVSADCFLHETSFRQAVNKLLPIDFRFADPTAAPVPTQHTICIAVMSKVSGPLEIPFFSKVSLKHAVRSLQKMNFKVTKLKIER